MTKTCILCHTEKPVSEYHKARTPANPERLDSRCKSCKKEYNNKNYLEVIKPQKLEKLSVINEIKTSLGCADCGYTAYACALDFDHREGETKEFSISDAIVNNVAIVRLLAEIEKCDVVCANCHRVRTAKRGGWLDG